MPTPKHEIEIRSSFSQVSMLSPPHHISPPISLTWLSKYPNISKIITFIRSLVTLSLTSEFFLETQTPVYSKNRKLSYQILRGWVFLLSSWYTGIGLLPSCGPPSLLRSCVVLLQAVLDSFYTGPSSKSPDDLGDVDKFQASLLHHD